LGFSNITIFPEAGDNLVVVFPKISLVSYSGMKLTTKELDDLNTRKYSLPLISCDVANMMMRMGCQ
jgi:hypothetical protein